MHKSFIKVLTVLASAAVAGGCSSMAADDTSYASATSAVSAADFEASQRRISELESALEAKQRDLATAEAQIAENTVPAGDSAADAGLFPPNPKAGECYARVLIPAKYQTISEEVMTRDAGERIEVIPAQYETAEETVMVKEASTTLEVVPAVYEEVQESVLVKPASTKIVEVPAVYETVTEQVVDKPAHTAWKKGPATLQTANVLSEATTDTGEIMCLVEVPASYKTVEKRVLVTPAQTEELVIPAEYKTVTKTVVKQPATTREVTVPAQYDTVTVTKLVAPADEKRIAIPAEYQTVNRTTKVSDEKVEWRQVMCEVNMTQDNVRALQIALSDKGYYRAGVDGVIGGQTLAAARKYALDNNLPAGSNYIAMEVVESLDLSL